MWMMLMSSEAESGNSRDQRFVVKERRRKPTWQVDVLVCRQVELVDAENILDVLVHLTDICPLFVDDHVGFGTVIVEVATEHNFHSKHARLTHLALSVGFVGRLF